MKPLYWQIRREFWEHRALWMAPLAIAVVLLLAAGIFGHIRLDFGDARYRRGHSSPSLCRGSCCSAGRCRFTWRR